MALGKTPIITGGKLLIEPNEWLAEIGNDYPALEKKYIGLELNKMPDTKAKTEALTSVRAHWLQTSPSIPYRMFPSDLVARFKVQLDELKKIIENPTNLTIVEASNGKFCRLAV